MNTQSKKICCFGELLLRMSPSLEGHWISEAKMPVYVGGAELNVATALSNWQLPARYITALPDNYLSGEIVDDVKGRKIDTSFIYKGGERIGVYYLPQGADLKHAGVIYDRAYSSFAGLKPGMIDWDAALDGCGWFHFSAISPALNADVAKVCLEGIRKATELGLTISVDLNYRARLWQYGVSPVDVMPELVQHCQVIMGNLWAVESLLGLTSPIKQSTGKSNQELIDAAGESMLQLHRQYPTATTMAYTFRLEEDYWAVLQHGSARAISNTFNIGHVIDKVGSGDCFMGGLIYGLSNNHTIQQTIDFAAAAAVGKLHETGDYSRQTVQQVQERLSQSIKA